MKNFVLLVLIVISISCSFSKKIDKISKKAKGDHIHYDCTIDPPTPLYHPLPELMELSNDEFKNQLDIFIHYFHNACDSYMNWYRLKRIEELSVFTEDQMNNFMAKFYAVGFNMGTIDPVIGQGMQEKAKANSLGFEN